MKQAHELLYKAGFRVLKARAAEIDGRQVTVIEDMEIILLAPDLAVGSLSDLKRLQKRMLDDLPKPEMYFNLPVAEQSHEA